MKIIQIDSIYQYSSTGRTTAQVHHYLLDHGIESYVAACNVDGKDPHFIKIGNIWSRKYHSFMSHLFGRQAHYSVRATKKIVNEIDRIKPDCCHLRILHTNMINLEVLLSFLAVKNIPTVLTLHDCWFFTGHCCYFTAARCDKWKQSCGNCPEIKHWNTSWFFDRSSQNLKEKQRLLKSIKRLAVVGVSDWVTEFVYESILKDAKIIRRIYNWVDTERFTYTESSIKLNMGLKDKFLIMSCAQNWSDQKGICDIITIAKRLPDYHFVILGNVPRKYMPMPNNVHIIGPVKSVSELVAFYSCCDVYLNVSAFETFGKVTIESMSCGTPVVAYKVTATPELIKAGCGYLVDYQDFDSVVNCLKSIERNGKNVYSKSCRDFVLNNFSKDSQIRKYIDLYTEIKRME